MQLSKTVHDMVKIVVMTMGLGVERYQVGSLRKRKHPMLFTQRAHASCNADILDGPS